MDVSKHVYRSCTRTLRAWHALLAQENTTIRNQGAAFFNASEALTTMEMSRIGNTLVKEVSIFEWLNHWKHRHFCWWNQFHQHLSPMSKYKSHEKSHLGCGRNRPIPSQWTLNGILTCIPNGIETNPNIMLIYVDLIRHYIHGRPQNQNNHIPLYTHYSCPLPFSGIAWEIFF